MVALTVGTAARPASAPAGRRSLSTDGGISFAIAAFTAVAIAALWIVVFATIRTERADALRAANERNASLAIAFEQYTVRTIENADAILRYLIREYARSGEKTSVRKFLADYTIDSKNLVGVILADERGDAMTTSYAGPLGGSINVADREHFTAHLASSDDKPRIGKPVTGRFSGKKVIPVTRRINKADGTFGGVAMALMEPSRFTDFQHAATGRPVDLISLTGYDGITRARLRGAIESSGEDISASALFGAQAKAKTGDIYTIGYLDGIARRYSYRKIPEYQLIALVGLSESGVFEEFGRRKVQYLWAAGLASAIVSAFSLLLILTLAGRRRSAAAAHLGNTRFLATFDQAALGIAHCDLNGRYLEVNQKLCDLLGYSREELLATRFLGVNVPGDLPAAADFLRRLQSPDSATPIEWETSHVRKDGVAVWCATTVSVVRDDEGGIEYLLAVVQDITERKKSEAMLRSRTARLQQLSRQQMVLREQEGRRLGRELHDRTGANLSAMLLSLHVLGEKLPPDTDPAIRAQLGGCELLLREAIAHVRDVLGELRPPALEELGLLAALSHYALNVAQLGSIRILIEGREPEPRLDAEYEISLFRIAQEALNNASRHAESTDIRVALRQSDGKVELSITDDGKGFDASVRPSGPASLGLVTMRERADAMQGHLVIEALPGRGTRIAVIVPHRPTESRTV